MFQKSQALRILSSINSLNTQLTNEINQERSLCNYLSQATLELKQVRENILELKQGSAIGRALLTPESKSIKSKTKPISISPSPSPDRKTKKMKHDSISFCQHLNFSNNERKPSVFGSSGHRRTASHNQNFSSADVLLSPDLTFNPNQNDPYRKSSYVERDERMSKLEFLKRRLSRRSKKENEILKKKLSVSQSEDEIELLQKLKQSQDLSSFKKKLKKPYFISERKKREEGSSSKRKSPQRNLKTVNSRKKRLRNIKSFEKPSFRNNINKSFFTTKKMKNNLTGSNVRSRNSFKNSQSYFTASKSSKKNKNTLNRKISNFEEKIVAKLKKKVGRKTNF